MKRNKISNHKKLALVELFCLILLTLYVLKQHVLPEVLQFNPDFYVIFNWWLWLVDKTIGNVCRFLAVIFTFQILREIIPKDPEIKDEK
ncbi:MAG: hypothetical protein SPJ92_09305 [Bariatricus sp.]|nr:hypothetical protein [Bariatricus sp.]